MPGGGLSCFACCPPIRPAGYDHADHAPSLRRMFSDNRAAFLAGEMPARPIVGFSCPGLGFLDRRGRTVGCLWHPARNGGRDLREAGGYAEKCRRESCPESRAFAALSPGRREALVALCAGMDPFTFQSRARNPVMRVLSFGPEAAAALAALGLSRAQDAAGWEWTRRCPPALGFLLGRMLAAEGPELLAAPTLAQRLLAACEELGRRLGPAPPTHEGRPLAELCGNEWEARLWRHLGRPRARAGQTGDWRGLLDKMLPGPAPAGI